MGESKRQEQQVFNDVINVGVRSVATPSRWAPYCRCHTFPVQQCAPQTLSNQQSHVSRCVRVQQ